MTKSYRFTKLGCYAENVSMAGVILVSPLLFTTFRDVYGISYSLLGLLVIFNFCSQLIIDLIFSFFPQFFNMEKVVRATPLITMLGLVVYSVMPPLFPEHAYLWLSVGTVIFSVAAGLCEVLVSPTVAAMPSDNPERDMSILHSIYAWGVVAVVFVGAFMIRLLGTGKWYIFSLSLALIPLVAFILFSCGKFPEMKKEVAEKGSNTNLGYVGLFFCCMFVGGMAENTMSQWCSDFVETAMGIPKFWGDILGIALFAVFLGLGRTLYAKFGKNIYRVIILGFAGSALTYVVAGVSPYPVLGLAACVLTGLTTSMLWPGTLIWLEKAYPDCGVVAYALMAAGGDMGSSLGPQLMGIVTDFIAGTQTALAESLGMTGDTLGMKAGMLLSAIFPIIGVVLVLIIKKILFSNKNGVAE